MGQLTNSILLGLVAFVAILFSLKYNSQVFAAEAFILGYLTAFLGNAGGPGAITFTLLLSIALVSLAIYKKWSYLGLGGIVAAYFMYSVLSTEYSMSDSFSFSILCIYFILFIIQSIVLTKKEENAAPTIIGIILNSVLFFIYTEYFSGSFLKGLDGLIPLIMAVVYFGSYQGFDYLDKRNFSVTNIALSIMYLTLAIALAINFTWVNILWSIEAVVLAFLFIKTRIKTLQISTYILSILIVLKGATYDMFGLDKLDLVIFSNSTRFISVALTAVCLYTIYIIFTKYKDELSVSDNVISELYSWFASGLLVLILFVELIKKYSMALSICLTLMAIALMAFGFLTKKKDLRLQSVILFGLVIVKVFLYDTRDLDTMYRTISYIGLGVVLLAISFIYSRNQKVRELIK